MNSPDRIKCCVFGCKRSYGPTALLQIGDVILCGKHWRAVKTETPHLALLHRQARMKFNSLLRKSRRLFPVNRGGQAIVDARWDRLLNAAWKREQRRWALIKRQAQMMEDCRYFEHGRQPKKSPSKRSAPERDHGTQRVDQLFMSSFKALKSSTSGKR